MSYLVNSQERFLFIKTAPRFFSTLGLCLKIHTVAHLYSILVKFLPPDQLWGLILVVNLIHTRGNLGWRSAFTRLPCAMSVRHCLDCWLMRERKPSTIPRQVAWADQEREQTVSLKGTKQATSSMVSVSVPASRGPVELLAWLLLTISYNLEGVINSFLPKMILVRVLSQQ